MMRSSSNHTALQSRQDKLRPCETRVTSKVCRPLTCRAVITRFARDSVLISTEQVDRVYQRNGISVAADETSRTKKPASRPATAASPASTPLNPPRLRTAHSHSKPGKTDNTDAGSPAAASPQAAAQFSQAEDTRFRAFDFSDDLDSDLPRHARFRSPLASVVAAATIISSSATHTRDAATAMSDNRFPARPFKDSHASVQLMRQVAMHQQNVWGQATKFTIAAAQLAQAVPAAGSAMVKAAADAAAATLSSSAGPWGMNAVAAGVAEQWSEDLARMHDAWIALRARGGTLQDLQAKVDALQAERDSLSVQLEEASRRAQFAESVTSGLAARLDSREALRTLDDAMQVFRRHISSVPADLTPSMFQEQPEDIIGKGGCATVYKWDVGKTEWAVKSDPITHRRAHMREFDPQRCGDLLPAFLPPHANIMAPRAWWVGPLAQTSQQHAVTMAKQPSATPGFKLFTLYERYSCSLWDHMQTLHTAKQQQAPSPATQPTATKARADAAAGGREALLLDLRSLLTVVRDVASALEHLAQHRVVHGDVKMENVLLVLQPDAAQPGGGAAPVDAGKPNMRIARAVLIDFGLCCMMPQGVEKLQARGGTWLFKAPEQMSGPPGMCLGGQERSTNPHVELTTDVWALGALIAMLCNNGVLQSKPGLPFGVPADQLLKWGDRPKGTSMEPFYMTWDDVLPKLPGASGALLAKAEPFPSGCAVTESAAALQYAHVMALLRRLAWGCMQVEPSQRLSAAQVRAAAADALSHLC